ncbi:MAG: hypothetical protein AAF236_14615 [Verrucomicrobiota bacterium]
MSTEFGAHLATGSGWDFSVDYQTQLFREDVESNYVGENDATTFRAAAGPIIERLNFQQIQLRSAGTHLQSQSASTCEICG